ncbi:amino acid-binding protein [Nocardia otitidiscaviarum]|uniref:Amino acid-binding protein n=1 Tax=Nocardia otitidiscaviarum TaxID=1823 RepID=A0A516NJJ3_9NOCA|nr:amino acid-binding protein [Nocardia otitidiscaviarum]MCP9625049.1 amino acid-binding protein [Nocardia otitidiscaviarum]QDP79065.1 amino acid-binding protein [Nocardia otitidiscaviarum]
MKRTDVLACEVCGRLPHPHRTRLALAKLAAVFPVELALHALVVHYHLPYLATVLVLTVTTTILVIWVVEPSAMRMLGSWLHGPELRHRDHVRRADYLWRIRVRIDDSPGRLESLAKHLANRRANILTVHVHHLENGVLDELVVSTPADVTTHTLETAVMRAGGTVVGIWPAPALALVDGQTKALTLATRLAADPDELPLVIAELLGAQYVTSTSVSRTPGVTLEIDTHPELPMTFVRAGEPFTPAEIARAHRLTDLALLVTHQR